jgi:hypothetical protein
MNSSLLSAIAAFLSIPFLVSLHQNHYIFLTHSKFSITVH